MNGEDYVEPEDFDDLSYQNLRAFTARMGAAFDDLPPNPTKAQLVAAVETFGMPLEEVEEHAYRFRHQSRTEEDR